MEKISIQALGQKLYDLPVGSTLHFKHYEDRDLFGATRINLFDCDTVMISYYGGLNTSVFDATVDHTPEDIASWIMDVIEDDESAPVYFMEESEVLPRQHELWGVTFMVHHPDGTSYRTLAASDLPLYPSREKAQEWIDTRQGCTFDSAFIVEDCDDPKPVCIDRWREGSNDFSGQKYLSWQRGKLKMHIVSIEIYNKNTGESSGGSDNIFYNRSTALEYIAHYFDDSRLLSTADSYFVCSIRLFDPSLEERQTYPSPESLFDLSGWSFVTPYYEQTVNK